MRTKITRYVLACLALVALAAPAQTTPTNSALVISGNVAAGSTLTIALTGAHANTRAMFALAFAQGTSTYNVGMWGTITLDLAPPVFPFPGGWTDANGDLTLTYNFPPSMPPLPQLTLYMQALTIDHSGTGGTGGGTPGGTPGGGTGGSGSCGGTGPGGTGGMGGGTGGMGGGTGGMGGGTGGMGGGTGGMGGGTGGMGGGTGGMGGGTGGTGGGTGTCPNAAGWTPGTPPDIRLSNVAPLQIG